MGHKVLRKLYNWMLKQAGSKHAEPILALISAAEASFFPIPPDIMLGPMVLAKREKAYRYALICTLASVLGGFFGYAIGYYLEPIGLMLLKLSGHADGLATFQTWFQKWGAWVILIKGVTPIPYKLTTIAAGLAHFNLAVFLICSVITRGARFFLVAFLFKRFGPEITEMIEKRIYLVSTIVLGVIIIGFILLKFIPH